jgi:5,5'-dehydrodivanillate O-demethylase
MTPEQDYTDFAHTGPGTLAGRFLRQFWQPVFVGADLAIGQAKPVRILSEDFTLFRGNDGRAHVVASRCAHRGTQLSVGTVEDDCIRCRYHGWKFDGSGQCVEAPMNPEQFAANTRITAYPTEEYLGAIFVFFGEGEPPAFPPFPGFYGDGVIQARMRVQPCNYFQGWENDWDELHVAWTHRTGGLHTPPDPGEKSLEETDWGVLKRARKVDGTERITAYFMPHILRLVVPSANIFSYRKIGPAYREGYIMHTPIDDEHHLQFATQEVRVYGDDINEYLEVNAEWLKTLDPSGVQERGEKILRGEAVLEDYLEYPNLIALEDFVAQVGQGPIADRSAERLSRTDADIVMMRQIFSRELQALAEGRPIKQWAQLAEMPFREVTEAVLANPGTGARSAAATR